LVADVSLSLGTALPCCNSFVTDSVGQSLSRLSSQPSYCLPLVLINFIYDLIINFLIIIREGRKTPDFLHGAIQ
jgi:hypothetical protein